MSEYIVNMSGNWSGKLTEIVRCRDCRYTGGEVDRGHFKGSCFCSMGGRYVDADGFCAWGERETNNKTGDIVTHDSRATGGTLTAEQVMAIAGKHQPDYCSDTHVCFDWQAIADELNSRTERTCRDTGENEWHFVCSSCGYEQNGYECWNYCPNCGAKVVSE